MASKNDYTRSGQELQRQHTAASDANALVRRQMENHQAFIKQRIDLLAKWCTHGLRPEALLRFGMLDLQQNETLRKCDPGSIFLGLLACAQAGLEPGALKQEAFLVPFFDGKQKHYRATFIAGWRGLIKQAKRSREVKNVYAHAVYERDTFKLGLGTSPSIIHEPALTARGGLIGAYAVGQLSHGLYDPEWMPIDELARIRAQAKRGDRESPAWAHHPDEMYRKTPIRRLAKRLPMGADYLGAAAIEQAHEDDKPEAALQVLDALTEGDASKVAREAENAKQMAQDVAGEDLAFNPEADIPKETATDG